MAALTADTRRTKYNVEAAREIPLVMAASTTIYAGSLVSVNSSGLAIPAADTASTAVMGVALEKVTSAASGTYYVRVLHGVEADFASTGLAQADVGKVAVVSTDNDLTDAATATNDISAGLITRFTGSTATILVGSGYAYSAA